MLASALAAQQRNALQTAGDALGVARIKTLQFTGSGANFSVGQNYLPNEPWPKVDVKNYTATINFDTGSMRAELLGSDFIGSAPMAQASTGRAVGCASPRRFDSRTRTSQ